MAGKRPASPETQAPLPGDFNPPPECAASVNGKHHFIQCQQYSTIRYYPDSAYERWCTYCGATVMEQITQ